MNESVNDAAAKTVIEPLNADGVVAAGALDPQAAQVEMQAGPHRVVSLISREAADELGLAPGMRAVAVVKATNVIVELPTE